MEQTDTTTTEPSGRSPELVRPVQGRMLAGVAQGVANNFGIAEWIPRAFFIITTFTGGLGLALYAAGWFFIRSEDETESVADRFFSGASGSRSWLGIGLMVVAGIIVLSNFTLLSGDVVWAGALLVVGLLLYLGYIPSEKESENGSSTESQEGVQQVTPTETLETEPTATDPTDPTDTAAGDSPAGGTTPPPPPATPDPTPPDLPPAKPHESSILGRLTIGVMLLGMGLLAILDNIETLPIDANPRHYMALAVTILGVGLIVGSIAGRARWLIILGVVMVPTLIFSPVFEYDWNTARVDRRVTPATIEEIQPSYDIAVGRIDIDLRQLEWEGQNVVVDASVNIGRIELDVPDDVGIVGTAEVDIGHVADDDRSSSGIGDPHLDWDSPGELGTVILDAEVDIGSIQVNR